MRLFSCMRRTTTNFLSGTVGLRPQGAHGMAVNVPALDAESSTGRTKDAIDRHGMDGILLVGATREEPRGTSIVWVLFV